MSAPPPWLFRIMVRVADGLMKLRRRLIPRHFAVIELGTMSWVAQSAAAFCELGLPDALAQGPRTADELAQQGYGDRDSLFRLLRALAAYDVVEYAGENRFVLGYLGRALIGNDRLRRCCATPTRRGTSARIRAWPTRFVQSGLDSN